ncbi:MAG: hypothetical protein GY716_24040 [bacterium]|nr:hypothetical protein [bacterium]
MTPIRSTLACALLTLLVQSSPGAETEADRTTAGGRMIWDLADDLDLLGDVWADSPLAVWGQHELFLGAEARTAIERTEDGVAFDVRDVEYAFELGWRAGRAGLGGLVPSAFVGQRGLEQVDAVGSAAVRFAAFGLETPTYRGRDGGRRAPDWRLAAGVVFEETGIDADAVLRGDARVYPWDFDALGGFELGFEGRLDSLVVDGELLADVTLGPAVARQAADGRRQMIFLQYQRSRNPLGIGHSAVLLGYAYEQGRYEGAGRLRPPDVEGQFAVGGGDDDRFAATFHLLFDWPRFHREYRVSLELDGNVLTAPDTNELYYLWNLAIERPVDDYVLGVYYYHRSNHQLNSEDDGITSLNVLDFGVRTEGWHRVGYGTPPARWGELDSRVHAGVLLTSSFGEDRRWHLRAGVRWTAPLPNARIQPYLSAELEAGDVERYVWAVGAATGRAWDVRVEVRDDEQYFSTDSDAVLGLVRYGF